MKSVLRSSLLPLLLAIAAVIAGGCSKDKHLLQVPNVPPEVRVTAAPIDTNAVCTPDPARSCYSLTLNWVGYDPDGRVDHYQYAVDPPDFGDTTWVVTTDNEKRLVFPAENKSPYSDSLRIARGFHVFVIAAVDNKGAVGPRVNRAFFSFTLAPRVQVTSPRPRTSIPLLPPSIRISWVGVDDDGVFTTKPKYYKYTLIDMSTLTQTQIDDLNRTTGGTIRQMFAPNFDGWRTVGGDTTSVQFTDLLPGKTYLFTVVGFDEAGAYSPVFQYDTNVLRFNVGFAVAFGPRISIFNQSFFKEFTPAFNPLNKVDIEVLANQPVTFYWIATPPDGADITGYRWMLDGADVFDDTPRTDELHDLKHWSTPSTSVTSATVGPFTERGDHYFYVSAEDNTGLRSLATVHMTVVVPTFDKQLLVVDDTRYEGDQFDGSGNLRAYGQFWPSAAELDTFLYAVGNVPWRKDATHEFPALSKTGIMAKYGTAGSSLAPSDYDTIGTRTGIADLSFSLAKLAEYRHVIWLTDFTSATYGNPGNVSDKTSTALRYMSNPGRLNSLGAYIRAGGNAWLAGGGGAYATLIPYDVPSNNKGNIYVFNHILNPRELDSGRFMYDVPKWQSIIRAQNGLIQSDSNVVRRLGRLQSNPGVYANLPIRMGKRSAATDPLPASRTRTDQFYTAPSGAEYLYADNQVIESVTGDPVDFKIDQFDDANGSGIPRRWLSSDTLNTVVSQGAVPVGTGTRASGKSMLVTTQGGGASTGDKLTHSLGGVHDWSGLLQFRVAMNQSTTGVQWRVRAIDDRGASASADLVPSATGKWVDVSVGPDAFLNDPGSPYQINFLRVVTVQLELARGDAAGTTEFDNMDVFTNTETAAVVDTLMYFRIPPDAFPSMTIYHGHDFSNPFVFSGFAPWDFQRTQCQQMFDFVLQKVWGIQPKGAFAAFRAPAFAPAHRLTRPLPAPSPGIRGELGARGSAGTGLRQANPTGALRRRNGTP